MLIVLPPSETKAFGGDGGPLDLESLSFSPLNQVREDIARDLAALPPQAALAVLGLSEKLLPEAEANTQLFLSPTLPAYRRYAGVLYDALEPESLSKQALEQVAIGSALFGVVGAGNLIPHYRLSGGTKLPRRAGGPVPTMKARWGKLITEELSRVADKELLIDLRSGTYQQLGKVAGALTVRVESLRPDGSRKVISHFNKHYKGLLARRLLTAGGAPASSIDDVAQAAVAEGFDVEKQTGAKANELVVIVKTPS